jgi:gluconate 2-dehydrogenase gamma chain
MSPKFVDESGNYLTPRPLWGRGWPAAGVKRVKGSSWHNFKAKSDRETNDLTREVEMADHVIDRRKALKFTGLLAASAAGQEFLAAWLPAAQNAGVAHTHHNPAQTPDANAKWSGPKFFSTERYRTVEILADLIIPTDDQPGAKEAQVARYVDFVVFAAREHMPQLQKEWNEGLTLLDKLSHQKNGLPFRELKGPQQMELLTEMSQPEHDPKTTHPGFTFYKLVKETTVEGFYTSKIGLVDVLGYQGCTYLSEFPGCTHPEHQG